MRLLDFFDGAQSETAPTIGNIVASGVTQYPDDATYEATEQGAPAEGNIYFNTTSKFIRYYNGTTWIDLVDDESVQTLVNKSIDADNNTITNLENDNIKALAAIDATKIHDGSVDNTEFSHLNGVTSNIQTQLDSKQDTSEKGAVNGYAPLDANQKVPLANIYTEALDNVDEYANFGSFPGTGVTDRLYVAADTGAVYRWSGSIYVQVGSTVSEISDLTDVNTSGVTYGQMLVYSGSTWQPKNVRQNEQTNYVINPRAEYNANDIQPYDDGAAALPVNGSGGTPTVVSIARTTTAGELLGGEGSFKISKSAADGQGEGINFELRAMDYSSVSKRKKVEFDYVMPNAGSNNYVDGDIRVFIIDIGLTNVIPVENADNGDLLRSETPSKFSGYVDISDSTGYRLVFHIASTNALSWEVAVDNIYVGDFPNQSIDDLNDVDTTTSAPSTNDVLTWDGSNWTPSAPSGGSGALVSRQIFTSSGTWNKPVGVNTIVVEVLGGGGGGGTPSNTAAGQACCAGGGAAGGYTKKQIDVSAISSETVTIGSGGSAGATGSSGSPGGTSSFGSHCNATGGGGGVSNTASSAQRVVNGSTGGVGSSGDINGAGAPGGFGFSNGSLPIAQGTPGGSSIYGSGGPGRVVTLGVNAGVPASGYGSGGGGGANGTTGNTALSGGAGSDGIVIVWEYS